MQEVRYHLITLRYKTVTAHKTANSDSISIVNYFLCNSFPRGTILYRYEIVFSLEDGSP